MKKCYKLIEDKWKLNVFYKTLIYFFKGTEYIKFDSREINNELYVYILIDKSKSNKSQIVISSVKPPNNEYNIINKDSEAGFTLWIREIVKIKIQELTKIADNKEKEYNYEIQMRRKDISKMKDFFEIVK